ncbi:MAG TPA: hypothetical protein VM243_08320 [Phycisphaerae bacterium]|nr:hypothetical protein [Phycisphaerae bacterium]
MIEKTGRGHAVSRLATLAAVLLAVACYAFVDSANAAPDQEGPSAGSPPAKAVPVTARRVNQQDPAPADEGGCGSKGIQRVPVAQQGKPGLPTTADRKKAPAKQPSVEVATEPPWPGWACEVKTIEMEPIWAGQPLSATWTISNSGEGDLQIQIKGT